MKFKLEFECDNAAFDGRSLRPEIVRLLSATCRAVQTGATNGRLHDSNGNHVGSWSIAPEDEVEAHKASED